MIVPFPSGALRAALCLWLVLICSAATGEERVRVFATSETGFARMIVSFPERMDLPPYSLKVENGVMSLQFEEPIALSMPDIAATLPNYISVARIDPNRKGIRFGLRTTLTFNAMEAGEQLFIDLLPPAWQGLPPSLPPATIAELTRRSREAAQVADQRRREEEARRLSPTVSLRVGRNPTFLRVEFDWSVPTESSFRLEEGAAVLDFGWPVPIDLYQLEGDLPPEILAVENTIENGRSRVRFRLSPGVEPRFYQVSDQKVTIDVDIADGLPVGVDAEVAVETLIGEEPVAAPAEDHAATVHAEVPAEITPYVTTIGETVRLVFPFEQDTPAAVFRRGDVLWMVFDTASAIREPASGLETVASAFSAETRDGAQWVHLDLSGDRLATLGAEGRAWVLSLGDVLLAPTEPLSLERRLDAEGLSEVVADLERPVRVHSFKDPLAGDSLVVVTAYPPARGATRAFGLVDFTALKSVHGLVIRPEHPDVAVIIEEKLAVIRAPDGLTVSSSDTVRIAEARQNLARREGFIDLASLREIDPVAFSERSAVLSRDAANAEGSRRNDARLELAKYLLANRYGVEAIGVLRILTEEDETRQAARDVRLMRAIASTIAGRPADGLAILGAAGFDNDVDALMWRAIAHAEASEFAAALADALASETVVDTYPDWVQAHFLLAATRAAVETGDLRAGERFLERAGLASMDVAQASEFTLLSGRIEELAGNTDAALERYGVVIAAEIRPTRAEAVFRTLNLLNETQSIEPDKAIQTLAAEAMLWRGNPLEAQMQQLLAKLYFRQGDYRSGFETVKATLQNFPESPPVTQLQDEAAAIFVDLFLNGAADALPPVTALGLFYDFREWTPAGPDGDAMIRNLARRLVDLDLLDQAASLLQYQLDNRLTGVGRAELASDLAVIYLANRQPELALRVLNGTRLPDLSPTLERQRRLLEGRAMIDAGRYDLALDMLSRIDGRDVALLRIDAQWKARRYGIAAEMLESLYEHAEGADLASQPDRMNLVKAGVGFVLTDDRLGLSRLRSKFAERMAQTSEWAVFDFVTSDVASSSAEFRQVVSDVANLDGLNSFLARYDELYGSAGAMTPLTAAPDTGRS